jgi:MFS family permease
MDDNPGWYRTHQMVAGAAFWAPTLFLYLVAEFGLGTALQLQAVYYAAVVVLEVPSGWLSDRYGRVLTLRAVAVCWLGAHSLFLFVPEVGGVIAAQVLLAAGYAFLSGTDVTFHLESLAALGRADEFERLESSSRQRLLIGTAVTAIAGGAMAMVDLRLPFAAALVVAGMQAVVAWRLVEPPRSSDRGHFGRDLVATGAYLRRPLLGWLAVYALSQVVVVHLAAEFTAPYLLETLEREASTPEWAALMTGAIAAVVAAVAALSLRTLGPLLRRIGLAATLIVLALVPMAIVAAMAATTALWVIPLLSFRRVQGAAASVVVPSLVASRVAQQHRATFLSLTSLIGRLGYVVVLLVLAGSAGDDLGRSLWIAASIAAGLWVVVAVGRSFVREMPSDGAHDHEHTHDVVVHTHVHRHDDLHHDHPHLDGHDEPTEGIHSHEHRHDPVVHSHAHLSDEHHPHEH